jgi:ankyrin repeat protein
MSEYFNFCYSGDPTPQAIEVPQDCSWQTLLATICNATGMISVSYLELYDVSTLVGERILEMDDFWNLCNYYTDSMVFVAFGQPPPGFIIQQEQQQEEQQEQQEGQQEQQQEEYISTLEHNADHALPVTEYVDRSVSGSHVPHSHHDHDPPVHQKHEQVGSSSWDSHDGHSTHGEIRSNESYQNYNNNNYTHTHTTNAHYGQEYEVDMDRYSTTHQQPREESAHDSDHDASDFSSSLASLMSGLSQLNASTPAALTLDQSIIHPAQCDLKPNNMANLKTSAEIEMERLQAEENHRLMEAEARKMREREEQERAEALQREEQEHRVREQQEAEKQAAHEDQVREEEAAARLRDEEEAAVAAAEKKRLRTESLAKQRLLAQEERRRELQARREQEAEEKQKARPKERPSMHLPPAAKDRSGGGGIDRDGDATISSLGSSISNGDRGGEGGMSQDENDSDDDEMWAQAAEHSARKRAQQAEKKRRVDTISAQWRSDKKEEKTVFKASEQDKKIPVMGSNRLRAIKNQQEKLVNIYFKSMFADSKSQDNGLVSIPVAEDCDWIDLTTTVSINLDLPSHDEIKQFILLDEDSEETSGAITDVQKFWKFYNRRYSSENKMAFLVFHSHKPEPKKFKDDLSKKSFQKLEKKNTAKYERQISNKKKSTSSSSSSSEKSLPEIVSFRMSSDYVDDRTKVQMPSSAYSWETLTDVLVKAFDQPATFEIKRLALFDEDGDELSTIKTIEEFHKILCGRYNAEAHVVVVEFEKEVGGRKQSAAVSAPAPAPAPVMSPVKVKHPSAGDVSQMSLLKKKSSEKGSAAQASKGVDTSAVFCQMENAESERVNIFIPAQGSWDTICECFFEIFGFRSGSTVTNLRLIDDDGDEVFSGISSERQFWKAVNNRYDSEIMTFLLTIDESTAPVADPTVSLFFDLAEGRGAQRVEVDVALNSSWQDISRRLFLFFGFSLESSVTRIDLIDEDGDDVLGAITSEKRFWKAVKSRYNSKDMVFVATIEGAAAGEPLAPTVPCTSLNFRLSTDAIDHRDSVNIPVDGSWDDVVAAILAYYNFDIPCSVSRVDLVDEDGDDVLGAITNEKKFWKAVNSRYNSNDMAFVVSVEAIAAPPSAASTGPTTSLNFKLKSDTSDRKDFVNIPVDGSWDDVVAAILAYYNFDIPCTVSRVDLVDEDGDDVLGAITSEKKFWKAVNNRYNSSEMVFIVSVEVLAVEEPELPPPVPVVPCTSLNFRLSTDAEDRKDFIDIPVDGSWDDVVAAILAFYNFEVPCSVSRVDLVDEDGDDVLGAITSEKKFWKAVNNRYNSSEMVFIVSVEVLAVDEPELPPPVPVVPCTSLNFRLSTDAEDRKDFIDIPVDGSWDDVVAAILAFYNFEVPCSVSRVDLVDEDGDEVFGSIVNEKKFWKAVNNRYNSSEMVFVVLVDSSSSCHDSLSEATTTQEMESVTSRISAHFSSPDPVKEDSQKSTVRWGQRSATDSTNPPSSSPPQTPASNSIDGGKSEYDGVVVQISFKLPLDPLSKAIPTNIPAMGEWEDVCESIKAAFKFSPKTVIGHVELLDEDGDTIQSSVKNTAKFWKACIDLYKEGLSVFNIHLAKSERRSARHPAAASAGSPQALSTSGSASPAEERRVPPRSMAATSRDSMDQSDHTTASSNLSTSGHNSLSNPTNPKSSFPHKGNVPVSDFLRSCCSGDVEFVSNCLQKGFDINSKDDVGLTGLHVASIQGQPKIIELLLDKGAQISCRDIDGMTPLHFACENNHVQIAIVLTRGGADTSLRNKVGLTALHYICMNGLLSLTVLIRDYMINVSTSAGLTLLHCAADMGHVDMVRYLVEHEAQIMPRDDDGMTPLHLACLGGHLDCVQYLVEEGSYWNTRDDEGMSPFLMAAKEGNVELASTLVGYGANVHVRNDVGNTAMHLACESGSMDLTKFLLDARVDINARNQGMETPLMVAMKCGHDNLVGWMQERGATTKAESREESEMRHQIDTKAEAAARAFESEEEINFEQDRNNRRARVRGGGSTRR